MEEGEVGRRRDLRKTHLVFSIDPEGCEDVDDTLSIRYSTSLTLSLSLSLTLTLSLSLSLTLSLSLSLSLPLSLSPPFPSLPLSLYLSLSWIHRHLKKGVTELGVHIADVSHFVRPGSLSDQEARRRSTSVYLADRRYDMLPPVLSAHLCSLLSGVDRFPTVALCVCVGGTGRCVSDMIWNRERERERKDREKERERVSVCVAWRESGLLTWCAGTQ